ncbi:NAD(P)-binding protein [Phialemonium atrogriseum]|uniref:NAD(P)-binding protein n=1 Tax=Phialemonium atrogriseum TaxID=1093897 RepID=A0AAJ0C0X0_9PEZI|nr:NAD(P)-binding protein [Phialemonium atrogriseum]KAK1766657.1 NAD(P)-binding protein [Phialemonium atrogriseum]
MSPGRLPTSNPHSPRTALNPQIDQQQIASGMASAFDINSLFRVDGMVAVITGGGTGIGLTMARALATNGAQRVYILGRRLNVLQAAAAATPGLVPLQCDVTSKDSLQAAVDRITAETGHINLLVANSGVGGPPNRWDPNLSVRDLRHALFTSVAPSAFTAALDVNVTSAFFTITAFLELLNAGNGRAVDGESGSFGGPGLGSVGGGDVQAVQSQVVITSSMAAFSRVSLSPPAYAVSKAAVVQITKQASSMLAKHGIRVNALAPGLFPSDLAAGMIGDRKPELEPYGDPKFIPARRFGGDEEMAGTILYLASRAGSYCNGLVLLIDGGRSAVMSSSY